MKPRILVVSSSQIDLVMLVHRIPGAGETVDERFFDYFPGGKGTNAATAISRLGGDCVYCTNVGDDQNGARLKKFFADEGIDTRFVTPDRTAKTAMSVVIAEENGNSRSINYPGASDKLSRDHIEEAFTCYPDALYLTGKLDPRLAVTATEFAADQKIPVFIDAGPADLSLPLERLMNVEVFTLNERDAAAFTGIVPGDMDSCLKAAMALAARVQAKYYIIKLGGRGAFIYDGKYYQVQSTYDVDVVDTAAAGDAFTAALTLDYLDGGDIKHACRFANAVGTLTVTREGALDSIPTIKDVREYINREKLAI